MPKSDDSWSGRLRQITALERPDHYRLEDGDRCYFVGEYTPRAGYAHSVTNQLITNVKKKPSTQNTAQWPYKTRAIADIAAAISGGLKPEARATITYVPIPPSRMPGDLEYDDRMLQVAQRLGGGDVREMITLGQFRDAAHAQENTRDPVVLKAKLRIQANLLQPVPKMIALVDDVLTTGCSFRACQSLIQDHLPGVPVIGLFAARRKPDAGVFDFAAFDL